MKTKKKFTCILCLLCLLLLTACSNTDQKKLDIYQYLHTDVKQINEMHNKAIKEYNAFMNTDSADSEKLLVSLEQSIIPGLKQAEEALSGLTYESEEVNVFVGQYRNIILEEAAALEAICAAVSDKDTQALERANESVSQAMSALEAYQTDVRKFAAAHEITLIEQESSSDQ